MLILGIITCLLAGCSSKTTEATTIEEVTSKEVDTSDPWSQDGLIQRFLDGKWDGSFISNDEHCASIRGGKLWIDCTESLDGIPDMGHGSEADDPFWCDIISQTEEGVWVQNHESEPIRIQLWNKGEKLKEFSLPESYLSYSTSTYMVDGERFVSRFGQHLLIQNKDGEELYSSDNILDFYPEGGKVFFSDFDHKNYVTDVTFLISNLPSHHVYFPREQASLEEVNNEHLNKAFNAYLNGSWNGKFNNLGDGFYLLDYDGSIIFNNNGIGNINTTKYNWKDLSNSYVSKDMFILLDGESIQIFQKGVTSTLDVPNGKSEILWVSDDNIIIAHVFGGPLYQVEGNKVKIIATKADDARVAYDTLYYLIGDAVYSLNWEDPKAQPEVFFSGAYGLSPYSDEGEGAIVPKKLANYKAYGYSNIYSPYGK